MPNENIHGYGPSHAQWVESLNDVLGTKLDEFGVFLAPAEAIPAIIKWTLSTAVEKNVTINDLISASTNLDEIADAIRDVLLLEIAEERPGTDPWEYESTIPVPLPIAMMTIHTLSVCTRIAVDNRSFRWAHTANSLITSWANAVSQCSLKNQMENDKIDVLLSDKHKPVDGPVVLLPQPGVAYTARMIEGYAKRVDSRWWRITDEPDATDAPLSADVDDETRDTLIRNLEQNAAMLRDFNTRYGVTTQPQQGS